ncbi:MAG: sigma factor-like helix-turn-helix DNA-binding protein [Myxococcota bacterium]
MASGFDETAGTDAPPQGLPEKRRRFPVLKECTAPPGNSLCEETACRYHLAHQAHSDHHREPARDCAIEVANEGPCSLEDVAFVLGVSSERVRQIEVAALEKLRRRASLRRYLDEASNP